MESAHVVFFKGKGLREEQEDEIFVGKKDGKLLALVADGMGGHSCGALASRIVKDVFSELFFSSNGERPEDFFQTAFIRSHTAMLATEKTMGATVAAVLVEKGSVSGTFSLNVFWLGDSRVYVATKEPVKTTVEGGISLVERRLWLLTEDDTEVWDSVKCGELLIDDIPQLKTRNMLKAGIFSRYIVPVDREAKTFFFHEGNRVLLCTDGVWECFDSHRQLLEVLSLPDISITKEEILNIVKKKQKKNLCGDNYSFVLFELKDELLNAGGEGEG